MGARAEYQHLGHLTLSVGSPEDLIHSERLTFVTHGRVGFSVRLIIRNHCLSQIAF